MFGFNPMSSSSFVASPYFVYIKNLISTVTSSIVTYKKDFTRALPTIIVNNTTILWKGLFNLLTISVNCGIILWKSINRLLSVFTSTLSSLSTVVISFINFANNKVIYARSIVNEITSVKFRTIFINKDDQL